MRKGQFLDMELRTSPHMARVLAVNTIMRHVIYALLPLVAMAVYVFGWSAGLVIAVSTASALLAEYCVAAFSGRDQTLLDGSAAITGLLLGLTLPPAFPLWMAAMGGVVSIWLGKTLFGGLGFNVFNPALVGRAFLQAAFPVAITTWSAPFALDRFEALPGSLLALPFFKAIPDAMTGATPLSALKFSGEATEIAALALGTTAGSAGETGAILIVLCGAYLALRRMLDWRIPAGILVTVAVLSALLHWFQPEYPAPLFMLFSGGLMLGAVFMATDMVTSPVTPLGLWLFAVLIGVLTVIIRIWGGLPEGVMYAILLANALTPLINMVTQPRIYGARKSS